MGEVEYGELGEDTITSTEVSIPAVQATVTASPSQAFEISSKVGAGAFAGALAVLTVYVLGTFGIDVPAEPSVAIGTVYAFVLSYIAKP